jgi:hypothetical protein
MASPQPQRSLVRRLFSTEGLLGLAGLGLLLSGLATGTIIAIFWGSLALLGLVALHFVRKRDWQTHWAEMERLHQDRQPPPQPPADDRAGHGQADRNSSHPE